MLWANYRIRSVPPSLLYSLDQRLSCRFIRSLVSWFGAREFAADSLASDSCFTAMRVESVMVTGANRGIGLEFVRQLSRLSEPPKYIFATYRNPDSLKDLKEIEESSKKAKIILIKMDVTCPQEIECAKKLVDGTVGERGLNLLINNAGVATRLGFPITSEDLTLHLKVNTEGPLMVLQAMLPVLQRAARAQGSDAGMSVSRAAVLNMTSMAGSCTYAGFVFTQDLISPTYKISKAALNMAMRVAAAKAKDKGILIVMMCPGWVRTDLGGKDKAVLEPEDSIADMINTLTTLDESHHGLFMDRKGKPFPF